MSAEPTKRVFMAMGDSSEFLKKPEKNAGTDSSKNKTIRLVLELFEPDEHKFPEFNYKKLVHIEKKKQKKIAKLPNGNHEGDPFGGGEDDDNVERIAKELEAKYGSGSSYGKASRLTTVDRGAGYDASDSFIDDTEAYDELIPDEIETDRGGFYINSGALEFKKLSNYERPGDEIRMPKAKKRALSTSSESSESEGAEEEKPTEKTKKKIHAEKKVKTNASSSDEQGKAKKLKKEKAEKPEKLKEVPKDVPIVKEPEKKKLLEPEKVLKTTTVKDMLRAKRDNLRKQEQGKPTSSGTTTATDDEGESESVSSLAVSESSRDSHPETAPAVNGAKEISLPENLPADCAALVGGLKLHAENAVNTKTNFFDANVMNTLVKIDNGAKSVSQNVRVQTFNYLMQFVPCTKKTLFTKVRKHRVYQTEMRFKNDIGKLRKIVSESMPGSITKYELEMKSYEDKKRVQNVVGDTSYEHSVPRKRYHWNDASRLALSEVVQSLQELNKVTKPKKETIEEFVLRKLLEDVVPLWPEGWIKPEDFKKELDRKRKKEAKAAATQGSPQVQMKPNTASATATTNGKAQAQVQKTDTGMKSGEAEPAVNGKASATISLLSPTSSASVIKRSSDHSINSIISASPSPPTISHSVNIPDINKPRVLDVGKMTSSELLKLSQVKPPAMPKFNASPSLPIDIVTPDKPFLDKVRRSDSSDSDCVEITGESKPVKPPVHHNNNNKVNLSSSSHPVPIAKKSKKHGSDDGEHETDYSKIIMGIQSLTDTKKASQFLTKNPLTSPVSQQLNQRKAETSHGLYESNGTGDLFVDPKLPTKSFAHNHNLHYSIGDLIATASRVGHDAKGHMKSSQDQFKSSHHFNHQQQQLTSSTNNNLHSISLSLTAPLRQSPSHESKSSTPSYLMPSILNLSNKK